MQNNDWWIYFKQPLGIWIQIKGRYQENQILIIQYGYILVIQDKFKYYHIKFKSICVFNACSRI